MQTEEKFIKTENAGRIMDASSQAVEKNGWLVVMGQPGTGKSTIYQELIRFWKSYPNKFILIETKSFKLVQTRTNILMKRIIKAINPDEHAPGDIETRYEILRNCLIDAYSRKKKVILLFDEAQDLNTVTFRELKKLHELNGMGKKNLFSIIMFAKSTVGFESVFNNRELGHRIWVESMKQTKPKEIFQIAEECFELKFKDTKDGNQAKSKFLEVIDGYPVTIEHIAGLLYRIPGFDGNVTVEAMRKSSFLKHKIDMEYYKITQREIRDYLKAKGTPVSLGAINNTLNGVKSDERVESSLREIIAQKQEALGETPYMRKSA